MSPLSYDRYCDEIVRQTSLLTSAAGGLDLTAAVPSCPGWNAARLLRHVGHVQRWAEVTVRSRATGPEAVGRSAGPARDDDPAILSSWLAEGAAALASALRDAGAGTPVWTPAPGRTADFYARRFTHETAVHRADAALAAGALLAGTGYDLDQDLALDAVDEWLELGALPAQYEVGPRLSGLLGPGRTLHFHATDTPPQAAAEWLVDLTGPAVVWRRAHERAAVAVRAPLTSLLLILYRRQPVPSPGVEVLGDAALLGFFLEQVRFG